MIKRTAYLTVLFVFISFTLLFYANAAMENRLPKPGADAVIVLGCGLNGYEPGHMLMRRLRSAAEYYETSPESVIVVSGGQGSDELIPEALAMKNYLVRMGIPEDAVIMEDMSASTAENLAFSKKILDSRNAGASNIINAVVVTSDFHVLRSMNIARQLGFNVQGMSSPSPVRHFSYVREYFALLWYYTFDSWK